MSKPSAEAAPAVVGKPVTVPIDNIRPNDWNPNVQPDWMFKKELKSIKKYGFVQPLVVREIRDMVTVEAFGVPPESIPGDVAFYEIVDGEHRWRAAKQLGYKELPCFNVGVIDQATAEELTVVLNETKGSPDEIKLSDLLKDLISRRGSDMPVRDIMPFSKERFDELVGGIKVDWNALEEQRKKLKEQGGGRWKELVFRAPYDAAAVIEQAIEQMQDKEGDIEPWRALELICADFMAGPTDDP